MLFSRKQECHDTLGALLMHYLSEHNTDGKIGYFRSSGSGAIRSLQADMPPAHVVFVFAKTNTTCGPQPVPYADHQSDAMASYMFLLLTQDKMQR
jgi:hypothetical protein